MDTTKLLQSQEQSTLAKNIEHNPVPNFFRASANDFKKIPGSPIAYWAPHSVIKFFSNTKVGNVAETRLGMATADNNLFLRLWHEVNIMSCGLTVTSREDAVRSKLRWFKYQKGGEYRKWYGNNEFVVDWYDDGVKIRNFTNPATGNVRSHNYNLDYIFKESVTWNALSSSSTSARHSTYSLFDNAGSSLFCSSKRELFLVLAYLNSNLIDDIIKFISPTLNYQPGDISNLPISLNFSHSESVYHHSLNLTHLSRTDWDSYETSWDFTTLPLLNLDHHKSTLSETYASLRQQWMDNTLEMQRLEEENNRLFIDAYGLQDELTPEVPLNEITLTCNPYYRYGKTAPAQSGFPLDGDLENRLRSDTMRELLSYGVGCMMGRYSLDKPGLILANAGETLVDFVKKVSASTPLSVTADTSAPLSDRVVTTGELSFQPDADGIIPILDGEWSQDDIVARTRDFLSAAFGADYLAQNVRFIEDALGRDLRKYFLTDFYKDHLQTYKKRPIYWLVQSPKKGFSCLIYLHRYTRDTINVVLNRYLRDYQNKLRHHIAHLQHTETTATTPREKTAARKQADKLTKVLHECEDWEREVLLPLAQARIELDLDDGVKVNYGKLGAALAGIPGMGGSG